MSIKYSKYLHAAHGNAYPFIISHLIIALNSIVKSVKLQLKTPTESGFFYHFKFIIYNKKVIHFHVQPLI